MKLPVSAFLSALLLPLFLSAQTEVKLHLAPRLGNQPFALNTVVMSPTGYEYRISRLQYYLSKISLTHDGGQVTEATDRYLLVNPATDSIYSLGLLDVENIEAIHFFLGVDSAHNHLDPSAFPAGHALAPQNPSMHWGWAAGYRFVAFEAKSGSGGSFPHTVEFHAIGDELYRPVTLPAGAQLAGGALTIRLEADYANLLQDLDASNGLVVHGALGPAVKLMNNLQEKVFTSATSPVRQPGFAGSFRISPNPAGPAGARVIFSLPAGGNYALTVTDLQGRRLMRRALAAEDRSVDLQATLGQGMYFIHLWQNGRAVRVEKLTIAGE